MTKEELARQLDGGEYLSVPNVDHVRIAKENGLLIVYGVSDYLCEFEGAFRDEVDCYDGGDVFIDKRGVVPDWGGVDHDDEEEVRAWIKRSENKRDILAVWGQGGYSRTYRTDIPHATFDILDDGEKYCRGMVIDIRDV